MIQDLDLEAIREAYNIATNEFMECKTYCLANSTICAWAVLWMLRDKMEAARVCFVDATKKALRKQNSKPTYEELEANKDFMEAFFNEADKNPDLETEYFLSPESAIESYYDNNFNK